MIQIAGLMFIVIGILVAVYPVKFAAEPQNKKQIAKGKEPMSEEEFAAAVQKGLKSGIILVVAGAVMFFGVMLLNLI